MIQRRLAPTGRLRPRGALEDIGNCAPEPKIRAEAQRATAEGIRGGEPSTSLVTFVENAASSRALGAAAEEQPLPVQEPQPEPLSGTVRPLPRPGLRRRSGRGHGQGLARCPGAEALEPPAPTAVETPGFAVREDKLFRAFSDVLLDVEHADKEDEDVEDDTNLDLCVSYVKDVYKYLGELEKNQPVRPKYLAGREIDGNMCALLVDWLVQIQMKCMLLQETLYMTVAIIDRFLQDNDVPKKTLQLVGISAMFIASKYEEVYPMSIGDFICITGDAYTKFQVHHMESKILKALDFCLGHPLPPHFLRRIAKIAKVEFKEYSLAKYLMELCIIDYDMVHFPSSKTAAAAACLTLKLLKGCKWTPTLEHYTSYTESDLFPVMQHMAKNIIIVNEGGTHYSAIKNKYAMSTNSTAEELNSSIIWDLALPVVKY
ncbi:G2/mitotic-specific cyclin-B1 [Strix uralensis]|uniref:G2/mitotic-specific cyclin-B1 n=1 Tax=Strix uralensis TaxID=36305 RepID=UPI003DA6FEFE